MSAEAFDGNELSLEEFIAQPDTVSFLFRFSSYPQDFLSRNPYIRVGKMFALEYAIIYLSSSMLDTFFENIGYRIFREFPVVLGTLGYSDLADAGITKVQQQPYLNLKGNGVLLGFVDTGIDYTQQGFIYEDGTSKIMYLWDQTGKTNPPDGYFYGTEYTNTQLNEALRSDNPYTLVEQCDSSGHGTFIASVAGSRGPAPLIGAAPDSEMIVVKLKKAEPFFLDFFLVPFENNDAFSSTDVMAGIEYIIERANYMNRPVAICLGLGTNSGGHDGFSALEEYISRLASRIGVSICVAGGNENYAKHHTMGRIEREGEIKKIDIMSAVNTRGFNIDIWSGASDRISLSVTSPTGESTGKIPARSGTRITKKLLLEHSEITVFYLFPLAGSGGQLSSIRLIRPTPGIWTITLYGDIILNGGYNAWLAMTGFIDPSVEFLAPSPNMTITIPATALGSICCGAFNGRNNSLYPRSSWGPTRLPAMAPDLVAPGVNVSGSFPYGQGEMSGTSVAAAITAGASALILQWAIVLNHDPAVNTYIIRSYLIRGCIRDFNLQYPNEMWGYGRLNLLNTFELFKDFRG